MSATEPEGDLVTLASEAPGAESRARGRERSGSLARGELVGRYVVLERLGVGGMGEVYGAYDPELDRKIAIKLLLASNEAQAGSSGSARLLREAQAMAKLHHPNVVAVHDVGTHEARVFVAMEYVDGGTLADWISAGSDGEGKPHPWPEVLARFSAAGEGLAAAHAAGLIHRDFKPANVLVGRDGSIRVADFGLARQAVIEGADESRSTAPTPPRAPAPTSASARPEPVDDATLPALERSIVQGRSSGSLAMRVTVTGATLGTPAYMAPEQYSHAQVDARADQFSFCVALWEALYGQRPFAGENLHALMFALGQGELREPPAGSEVPAAIRKALIRGLDHDPQRRWPDMPTLLAELRSEALGRRRRMQLTLGGLALLAAIVGGVLLGRPEPAEPVCAGAAAAFGDALTPARREAIASRFAALEQQWAQELGQRLLPQLDAWAETWQAAWTDACQATHVRAEQSPELLDRRLSCLDRQRRGFVKLVDALAEADAALARKADGLLVELGSIAACSDRDALLRITPMPADPELARAIVAADEAIVDAQALYFAGQVEQARAALERQREIVAELDHPPLSAAYETVSGRLAMFDDEPVRGERALERAFARALEAGDDRIAAQAARVLAYELNDRERVADASRWLAIGAALGERLDDDNLRAELGITHSQILAATGDYLGAEAAAQSAHELFVRTQPDSARVGDALYLMAVAAARDGRNDDAVERIERARAVWRSNIGPRHPHNVAAISLLGIVARTKGDYAAAERAFREALEINEDTYGAGHVSTTSYMANLGVALRDQGKFEEAIALLERALEIREAAPNSGSGSIGRTLVNLAQLQREAGRIEQAAASLERGEALLREALGDEHRELIIAIHIRGQLQLARGELEAAERSLDDALRRATLEYGPEHPALFELRTDAARVALARGEPQRAAEHLVERSAPETSAKFIGEREFVRARVDAALGRDQEARAAALRAREAFEEDGPGSALALAEVEAWLRARD
ncbi:MAG: serine/threonine-protein kinase [Enhygromyxa sp.]